ncbi:MAG: chorismate synthase [Spirochaetaceae bacterium]|jgi:chorismate synthase|nr:chorismate synthase [Spirochaetaceae bacterium]
MAGNSFGSVFVVTAFGESHGPALGCVIDGCPAGIPLDLEDIRRELRRRRPGGGGASTTRAESDEPELLSGVFEGRTLGTPLAVIVRNAGQRSSDYGDLKDVYRPGHADWTWEAKYGVRDYRGGGRSSGRETVSRVAAGAVAKRFLAEYGVTVRAWTSALAGIRVPGFEDPSFSLEEAERNSLRVPQRELYEDLLKKIEALRSEGDSAGGEVSCRVEGLPPGLGEPVFGKLDALLASALLSLGGAKGIEFGAGFAGSAGAGSEQNDAPAPADGTWLFPGVPALRYLTNRAGGMLGGIATGMPLEFRVAFKPVPSIAKPQRTVDRRGVIRELSIRGRHDVCIPPRAVPVVEAMTALVLADLILLRRCDRL